MVKVAIENSETAETKSAPVRRKSWRKLKLVAVVLIVIVAAPSIVSLSGLTPAVLRKVHPKLADAVSFRRVTMHWWAPVEVMQLKVRDLSEPAANTLPSAEPLLCEIERISTVEPLWRILLNGGRGTGLVLKSPQLNLTTDERGTNLDRTLAAISGESIASSADRFPFRVTVEGGSIQLRSSSMPTVADATPASVTLIENNAQKDRAMRPATPPAAVIVSSIDGTFSSMDTQRWLPQLTLTASIAKGRMDSETKTSAVSARTFTRPTRLAAGLDDVVGDFPEIPLEDLAGTDESGDVSSARIQIRLQPRADDKGRQTIQIGARDVDLRLVQPFLSMLGLETSCEGTISGGIDARLAGATFSEGLVARLLLKGDGIRVRQQTWSAEEWLNLGAVEATGGMAIADDGMLFQDLRIHTEVADLTGSGELRHGRPGGTVAGSQNGQMVELKGSIDLARLATSLRKTLAIHEDVTIQRGRLTFGVRGSAESVAVQKNLLVKEALAVAAADANAALTNRTDETSSAGQTGVRLTAFRSTASSEHGSWQFVAQMDGLEAIRAGKPLKVDSSMRVDATGSFVSGLPELLRARLTADFGTIDCAPDEKAWRISGLVQPASLWQQLQQFADVPEPGLRGDVSFQSRIALQGDTIQLTETQMISSDLKLTSVALDVTPSNPLTSMLDGTVNVEGSGGAIRTLLAPWHDASWLAERSHVVGDLSASPQREIQLTAHVTPENIAALQRSGVLSVSQTNGRTIPTSGFSGAVSSVFAIDEADVALTMTAAHGGRTFEISNGTIRIPGVTARLTGSVSVPDGETVLDLTADATYDLDLLSRRLFAPDSGLRISGQGRDTFRLTGSPSAISGVAQRSASISSAADGPPSLQGSGRINWTSAGFSGLQLGKAAVQATLENSVLRSEPIECTLNGGELNVMPQYDLASSRLQLGSGSRMQNLQLTPELCRTWLGYVAPMLADSTDVTGQISARVERFIWDVSVPENSDVSAQLTIHQAQASPGSALVPMLQVVDLLRRRESGGNGLAERSLTLPEQTIPVQVRQGFVVHEGLMMDLAGYRLKTSGAVGMNKQLQITLDVPLEKNSASGAGRSIRIPLRGTISSPQPDTGALLQSLGTQKIQEKVGEQLDKSLNKLLDKF